MAKITCTAPSPAKFNDVKMFGDTLLYGDRKTRRAKTVSPELLKVSVRYILTPDNALRMDYRVSTDEDTIINLTNHTYFNLDGGGNVLGQKLRIYASNYLEGNNETCPTGKILPVDGTPMDFRTGKPLGRDLDTGFYQTTMAGGGFDHCYVLDAPGRQPEPLRLGVQRQDWHQHEDVHHPAGHPALHRQLPAELPLPRQGRRPAGKVRRLCP